ncbi:TRAP transporter small permease subunit [Arsenicitalea aurantiaca]|nr:TRAP transporter small permease [Arsenicitalea aurantiaca]
MKAVALLFSVLRHLSTALALAAGLAVFILAFLIAIDVLARRFAGFSLQGTDEIGGYVLAALASLGFAYVLFERGFTRIDLLVRKLPPLGAAIANVLAYVSLAAVAVFFAHRALLAYRDTLHFNAYANTPLQTPMWIPQGFWAVGMSFFAACAVLYAIRAVVLLFIDRERLDAEYGVVQIADEVAEIADVSIKANARAAGENAK